MTSINRTLTWLHVSDFHIHGKDPSDMDRVLDAQIRAIRDLRSNGTQSADIIFATGDVANEGQHGEYERATIYFDKLLDASGLDKSRLFVIGGNHDVDRKVGEELIRSLNSLEHSEKYFGPKSPKIHFTKMSAFQAWHNQYFTGFRSLKGGTTCEPPIVIHINGISVAVVAINSAIFSQDNHDQNSLWVGRRCINSVVEEIDKCDADVRVALMHHPLYFLNDMERSSITASMRDNFDIILRGHLHEPDAQFSTGLLGTVLEIASGASYQGSKWPNVAFFGTLNFEAGKVSLYPIEYKDTPRSLWVFAPGIFPKAQNYIEEYTIPWKSHPENKVMELSDFEREPEPTSYEIIQINADEVPKTTFDKLSLRLELLKNTAIFGHTITKDNSEAEKIDSIIYSLVVRENVVQAANQCIHLPENVMLSLLSSLARASQNAWKLLALAIFEQASDENLRKMVARHLLDTAELDEATMLIILVTATEEVAEGLIEGELSDFLRDAVLNNEAASHIDAQLNELPGRSQINWLYIHEFSMQQDDDPEDPRLVMVGEIYVEFTHYYDHEDFAGGNTITQELPGHFEVHFDLSGFTLVSASVDTTLWSDPAELEWDDEFV